MSKLQGAVIPADILKVPDPFELKPFMRIEIRNGQKYVVLVADKNDKFHSEVKAGTLIGVHSDGWLGKAVFSHKADHMKEFDIVAVYDSPSGFGDYLKENFHGKRLWSLLDEAKLARRKDISSRMAKLQQEIEELRLEREELGE